MKHFSILIIFNIINQKPYRNDVDFDKMTKVAFPWENNMVGHIVNKKGVRIPQFESNKNEEEADEKQKIITFIFIDIMVESSAWEVADVCKFFKRQAYLMFLYFESDKSIDIVEVLK